MKPRKIKSIFFLNRQNLLFWGLHENRLVTGSVLAVLGCVERWLGEQKVVVFGLGAQIFEDTLLQEALHQVPVFDDAVPHRILKNKNKNWFTLKKHNSCETLFSVLFMCQVVFFTSIENTAEFRRMSIVTQMIATTLGKVWVVFIDMTWINWFKIGIQSIGRIFQLCWQVQRKASFEEPCAPK